MSIQLLGDSCCDTTPALKNLLGLKTVPIKILVGDNLHFVDDETLDTKHLLTEMKRSKCATSTACPAPEEYAEVMRACDECIVVTLTSRLSGSYNSAVVARELVLEKHPDKKIFVVDSESAASGQTRLLLLAHELIAEGKSFEEVVAAVDHFAKEELHTFFVLDSLDNLIKNGRIGKAAGVLGSMLSLRPVMCDNGHGEISCREKVRGTANALRRLVDIIGETTADADEKSILLVMSQCNCPERAFALKKDLLDRCAAIRDVLILPSGGVTTVYANDGGVVLTF